jgi:hypothetical protein
VLDSGWGMLKQMLLYKSEYAGRSVKVVNERNTTRASSNCGSLTGPKGGSKAPCCEDVGLRAMWCIARFGFHPVVDRVSYGMPRTYGLTV